MPFHKGNKFGKGRPKGTGKRQNVSEAFQGFLAGKQGGKERFTLAMERLFKNDLKTFFAYAYGKPVETMQHQVPDGGVVAVKWYLDPEAVTGPAPETLLKAEAARPAHPC